MKRVFVKFFWNRFSNFDEVDDNDAGSDNDDDDYDDDDGDNDDDVDKQW